MKRIIIIVISLLIMPILVNAETFTYEVCKNGCEYNELNDVFYLLENKSMDEGFTADDSVIIDIKDSETYTLNRQPNFGSDKDFYAINYNISSSGYKPMDRVDMKEFVIKSDFSPIIDAKEFWVLATTISVKNINFNETKIGGGADYQEIINVKGLETNQGRIKTIIEDCEDIRFFPAYHDPVELNVKNSKNVMISAAGEGVNATIYNIDGLRLSGAGTFQVEESKRVTFSLAMGYANINESQLDSFLIMNAGINIDIKNSNVGKIINYAYGRNANINIYNSKIIGDIYYKIHSDEELSNLVGTDFAFEDVNTWPGDYFDYSPGDEANTYIHFDKNKEINIGDKLNILDEFEYLNKNKNINYSIENEQIAKIQNNEITALNTGTTNVVATTDDGHFIFTIHLTVYKAVEKNVTMKAQNKLKLNTVFKDLDISSLSDDVWEISNPKVAKVINGEIISLQKGETDIVAIINGVKYIYHLTVSDTLVSIEIKVPITGKNIKLWIVVVTALLLSVIGVCSYILIRKRK